MVMVVPQRMNRKLQILHLEDDPDFAELVRSLFAQDGLDVEVKCVGNRAAFEAALDAGVFDAIISDYHLPSFSGLDALAMVRKKNPHIPFILVSGTIGEQAAIESLKAGATDYLLKQQPDRLPSAVRRAVQEAEERARLRAAETELVRREKYFRTLTENSLDVLCILSRDGNLLYASPSIERVLGYTPEELRGQITSRTCIPTICRARRRRFNSRSIIRNARSKCNFAIKTKTAHGSIWNWSARTGCRTRK